MRESKRGRSHELARVRTVRSLGARRVVLYEDKVVLEPSGRSVPVAGCEVTVGKAGAGATVAASLAAGPVGAAVSRMRQCVQVAGSGSSFTAYCYGRDREELSAFVEAVRARATL